MKKLVSILVIALLVLTACGTKDDTSDKQVITFWGHQNEA